MSEGSDRVPLLFIHPSELRSFGSRSRGRGRPRSVRAFRQLHNLTKDGLKAYSFDYQENSYLIIGYDVGVQEGNIRKTMAARGLVNGRARSAGVGGI